MKATGIIFDMDGVLLDTMPMWEHVASDFVRSMGREPEPDLDSKIAALSVRDSVRYIVKTYEIDIDEDSFIAGLGKQIGEFYRTDAVPKEGTNSALNLARQKGIKACVATTTPNDFAAAALRRLGFFDSFEFVISGDDVGKGKDSPDIYEQALCRLRTPKDETPIVEDTLFAMRTAKAAGFTVIAVRDAASKKYFEEIERTADFVIDEIGELERVIE